MKTIEFIITYLLIVIICFLLGCNVSKRTKPCTQCPQYTNEIEFLKKQHTEDSLALDLIEQSYYELWEENQIFASMLGEIENQPGGHEILKNLWQQNEETNL